MNRLLKLISILPLVFSSVAFAQNNTNSPYSYYGIGELDQFNYSQTAGMGGVAYGIKSGNFINNANPASYAGIDSLRFLLDVGISGDISRFESNSEDFNSFNGNFKRIALGLRLLNRWSVSLGFMPYTTVGYKVSAIESIIGQTNYSNVYYSGEGGLSKFYLGNSFKIINGLSIGVNISLISGYINKIKATSSAEFPDVWYEKHRYKPSASYSFDFGTQYSHKLNDKYSITIGLVTGLENKINLVEYFSVYSASTTGYEEKRDIINFYQPMFYGGGFALTSQKWNFAADYQTQLWDKVANKNKTSRFVNTHHIALGTEYCPERYLGRTVFKRMTYQVGAHYDRTSVTITNCNYDIYGLTLGVVIPFKMQLTNLAFSVDLGTKGKKSETMFRENYIKINLGVNFSDFWFIKRRYD